MFIRFSIRVNPVQLGGFVVSSWCQLALIVPAVSLGVAAEIVRVRTIWVTGGIVLTRF